MARETVKSLKAKIAELEKRIEALEARPQALFFQRPHDAHFFIGPGDPPFPSPVYGPPPSSPLPWHVPAPIYGPGTGQPPPELPFTTCEVRE